jgi:hypothetical protein
MGFVKLRHACFPISIFMTAFLLRVGNVHTLPLNHDEVLSARRFLAHPEDLAGFLGIPRIFFVRFLPFLEKIIPYGKSVFWETWDIDAFAFNLRLTPVLVGALTVLFLYLLAKELYGEKEAIISSLLLCFLPWHIISSRFYSRFIWIPLYGCIIFLFLFKAVRAKTLAGILIWFMLSLLYPMNSRMYQSGILFVPIFLISLPLVAPEIHHHHRRKIVLIMLGIFTVLFIFPVTYTIMNQGNIFWNVFYRSYHTNVFKGNFLDFHPMLNLWNNVNLFLPQAFFTGKSTLLLYGVSLKQPLLIHIFLIPLIILSLLFAVFKNTAADRVLLLWLIIGFLGAFMGTNIIQARYVIFILPPLLVLLGRVIAVSFSVRFLFDRLAIRIALFICCTTIFLSILTAEILQWSLCYHRAPFDSGECIANSYGCKEAADYLSRLPGIEEYPIVYGTRMTVDFYLDYFFLRQGRERHKRHFRFPTNKIAKEKAIYVLWAAESHPSEFWINSSNLLKHLEGQDPIYTVYYPDGIAAIKIFQII